MSTPDTFSELLQEELTATPDPAFAREMDEWAAAGFPRRESSTPTPKRRRRTFTWLRSPAGMATAASAVAAVLIAVVMIGDSVEQDGVDGDIAATTPAEPEVNPLLREESSDSAGGNAAPAPVPSAGIAPGER